MLIRLVDKIHNLDIFAQTMGDDSFEADIGKLSSEVNELAAKRDKLRRKFEAEQIQATRYSHLVKQKEDLEREIAKLEGREGDEDYSEEP
jgi:outer membrane murein-binding lipoprotein Lpp